MNDKLASWLVDNRFALALLSVVSLVIFSYGMSNLKLVTDYRIFFNDDYPPLVAHEYIENTYSRADNIMFVVGAADGEVFTKPNLNIIETLTNASWELPFSTRVDSITNFQYSHAEGDDLIVEQLVEDASQLNEAELKRIKEIALNEIVLLKRIISPESHVTVVNVSLQLPDPLGLAVRDVMESARNLANKIMADNPGTVIHLVGQTPINNAFDEVASEDLSGLLPIMFFLIVFLSAFLLRSASATVSLVLLIVVGVIMTMGATGWVGWDINNVNATAPTIILTLAVADCVHLLTSYLQSIRSGVDKISAMRESLRINIQPVFLTSITTAIGFLSMNFSDSPPFRELGNISAIGVMGTLVYSLTLLPCVAILLTRTNKIQSSKNTINLNPLSDWIIKNQTPVLLVSMAVAISIISFAPLNALNDDNIGYFDTDTEIRIGAEYTQDNLTGLHLIEYSFNSGEIGGISEPAFLQKVDRFTEWYRSQPEVDSVYSYTDTIKRLNKNMHSDDIAYYKLPESRELASQYLLLYEMSLPFGLDLTNQINPDKSAIRFTGTLKNVKAKELIAFEERAQQWLNENTPGLATPGSSVSIMFAHIGQSNIKGMMKGTVVAILIISLTLIVFLRSFKYGLLSLIPNAFPAGIMFGLWGVFVGEVNLGAAAVFSVTLGIVVDDTVHFLSKYIRARKELNSTPEEAVRYAFNHVGVALIITTIILAVGFFTLYFSNFDVNSTMGLMVAGTITIALIFDMLFLPGLLLKEEHWEQRRRKEQPNANRASVDDKEEGTSQDPIAINS